MSAGGTRMLSFAKEYGNSMIAALSGSNIFFCIMLIQACVESGFGTSNAARNRNNFFGIGNGQTVFGSTQQCFSYYVGHLSNDQPYVNYKVAQQTDPYSQIRAIANAGYYDANVDYSLDASQRPPNKTWTAQQSADRYYNTMRPYIGEILLKLPIGTVSSPTASTAASLLATITV